MTYYYHGLNSGTARQIKDLMMYNKIYFSEKQYFNISDLQLFPQNTNVDIKILQHIADAYGINFRIYE